MQYGIKYSMMDGESASGQPTNSGQPGDADSDEGSAMVGAGLSGTGMVDDDPSDNADESDAVTGSQVATPGLDDDMDHRADNSGPGL